MAVEHVYANSTKFNSSGRNTGLQDSIWGGADERVMFATLEIAAANDDGSKFVLFPDLPPNLIPLEIRIANDAITAGTAYDVGLYESGLGAVIDADAFAANLDMSVAAASLAPKTAKDGMAAVAIENWYKRLFEHAGHTPVTKKKSYDIVLTADTIGSAAGTIAALLKYAMG